MIPPFLNKDDEVKIELNKRYSKLVVYSPDKLPKPSIALKTLFVHDNIKSFKKLGCNEEQAINATTHVVMESRFGMVYVNHNGPRIVARPSLIRENSKWFRIPNGSTESYFLSFTSLQEANKFWLSHCLPKPTPKDVGSWPDQPKLDHDYRSAGLYFWRVGDRRINGWYERFVAATGNSNIQNFNNIVPIVERIWNKPFKNKKHQRSVLRLFNLYEEKDTIDESINNGIVEFQRKYGLPQTGHYNTSLAKDMIREIGKIVG